MSEVPGEVPEEEIDNPTPEQFELTPEIEAKIMAKVPDVKKLGLGYNVGILHYGWSTIATILANGLLPNHPESLGQSHQDSPKKQREKYAAERKEFRTLYFNIVGRTPYTESDTTEISHIPQIIEWSADLQGQSDFIITLFDTDHMKEFGYNQRDLDAQIEVSDYYQRWKGFKFFADAGYQTKDNSDPDKKNLPLILTRDGNTIVDDSHGFFTQNRIAPRFLRGLVFSNPKYVPKAISAMQQTNSFLPILDQEGNLLWPRQMSYEEVKEFVAKRDNQENQDNRDN